VVESPEVKTWTVITIVRNIHAGADFKAIFRMIVVTVPIANMIL
jgi:hypothetical protein